MNCKVFSYKSFPSTFQVFSSKKHTKGGRPLPRKKLVWHCDWGVGVAVAQLAVNQWVGGPNPSLPVQETKFLYNNSVKLKSVEKELFVAFYENESDFEKWKSKLFLGNRVIGL